MTLENKVAFVTGAGRGIGEAIALRLAHGGASVFVSDLNEAAARETVAQISETYDTKAWAVGLDVSDFEAVNAAIDEAAGTAGRLDVMVNNAGWDKLEPFVKSTPDTWQRVIDINYGGVLNCCHASLRHMLELGSGSIVNIGSDAGRVGSTGEAVYSGAKGAVIAFSKTVAREVARKGIRVNTVCPGPTATPLVLVEMAADNEKLIAALEKAIPMGRLGQPSDVANAVAFMASDEASFITGQTLSVSGGLTMA